MSQTVLVKKEGPIGYLTFNRQEAMNTFNAAMSDELPNCVAELENDAQIRLVVMQGNGPVFMAGGDVNMFAETLDTMPANVHEMATQLHQAVASLYTMPKPVLAKVHGAVAGAGLSLMLAADLVLASEETVFNLAYTHLGTSPDGGASYALPRLLGRKQAMQLLLLSERFTAPQALEYGLINWIANKETFHEKAQALATQLAKGPTKAYAKIKALVHQSLDNTLSQQLEQEAQYFAASTITEDFKRGVTSFVNKTPAEFTGC